MWSGRARQSGQGSVRSVEDWNGKAVKARLRSVSSGSDRKVMFWQSRFVMQRSVQLR